MLEVNKTEKTDNPLVTSGSDGTTSSLEDLIAQIDRETGQAIVDVPDEIPSSSETGEYGIDQFITFALQDILLALPLTSALEIGHRPMITPLFNLPSWILGVSNIRGEVVSIVDLKAYFELPSSGPKGGGRLIIVHNRDIKVGMLVDRIMGILSLDQIDTDIQENPHREGEMSSFISGVVVSGENLLNILDVDKLLSSPRMTSFRTE
jgi:purine-binding chemotaxis protein CheW